MISRISTAWSAMPLRRRLVLGLLAVVAVTLGLVGTATYLSLRSYKVSQIDSSLMQGKARFYAPNERDAGQEAVQLWTSSGAQVYAVFPDGTASLLGDDLGDDSNTVSSADASALASVEGTNSSETAGSGCDSPASTSCSIPSTSILTKSGTP